MQLHSTLPQSMLGPRIEYQFLGLIGPLVYLAGTTRGEASVRQTVDDQQGWYGVPPLGRCRPRGVCQCRRRRWMEHAAAIIIQPRQPYLGACTPYTCTRGIPVERKSVDAGAARTRAPGGLALRAKARADTADVLPGPV